MCNNAFLLGKTLEQFIPPRPEHRGMIAQELVSVEPLKFMPSGSLHYLDYIYTPSYRYVDNEGMIILLKRNHKQNNKLIL